MIFNKSQVCECKLLKENQKFSEKSFLMKFGVFLCFPLLVGAVYQLSDNKFFIERYSDDLSYVSIEANIPIEIYICNLPECNPQTDKYIHKIVNTNFTLHEYITESFFIEINHIMLDTYVYIYIVNRNEVYVRLAFTRKPIEYTTDETTAKKPTVVFVITILCFLMGMYLCIALCY